MPRPLKTTPKQENQYPTARKRKYDRRVTQQIKGNTTYRCICTINHRSNNNKERPMDIDIKND